MQHMADLVHYAAPLLVGTPPVASTTPFSDDQSFHQGNVVSDQMGSEDGQTIIKKGETRRLLSNYYDGNPSVGELGVNLTSPYQEPLETLLGSFWIWDDTVIGVPM